MLICQYEESAFLRVSCFCSFYFLFFFEFIPEIQSPIFNIALYDKYQNSELSEFVNEEKINKYLCFLIDANMVGYIWHTLLSFLSA